MAPEPRGIVDFELDPSRPSHISIFGRKGSGKSTLAGRFFDSYPFDRLVIDPTGDLRSRMPPKPEITVLTAPVPARWPLNARDDGRSTVYFKPDYLGPSYDEDLDRALGMAFSQGRCLAWVDEVAEITTANKTLPHTRRVLHQSRHRSLSLLFCGPRPMHVNPLVVSQADYIAIFDLPNPADRKRLADVMGWDPSDLDERVADLDQFEWLWFDARAHQLVGPLPPVSRKQKWPTPTSS